MVQEVKYQTMQFMIKIEVIRILGKHLLPILVGLPAVSLSDDSQKLLKEFYSMLSMFDQITGNVYVEHRQLDHEKFYSSQYMSQGEILLPDAREILLKGLVAYPLLLLDKTPTVKDLKVADFVGYFTFTHKNSGSIFVLNLEDEDFVHLAKLVRVKNDKKKIREAGTLSARWVDCERIVYLTGKAQEQSRVAIDTKRKR